MSTDRSTGIALIILVLGATAALIVAAVYGGVDRHPSWPSPPNLHVVCSPAPPPAQTGVVSCQEVRP